MDAEALYYDEDYQASYEAYDARLGEGGNHRDALEYSAGTAAFKTENYVQAAEHLGRAILADDESLRSKAYYNLGNTLFRLGQTSEEQEEIEAQWQSAIDHYAEAEALGGDLERNARNNREVVEKHLAALKGEEPPESEEKQDDQSQDGEEGEDKEEQNQDGQDSQDKKPGEEGQEQEKQDQSEEGQEGEQQPQDEQEGKEGEQQQSQDGQEGKEGEQGKPGEGGNEEEQPSPSSQEEPGEEGKPGEETKELDGEVKAANDKGQKPEGDPKAKEGPQKPSAYELTPDGKLSEAAARALLESLEGEEVKAPFEVRRSKQRRRVIRDW